MFLDDIGTHLFMELHLNSISKARFQIIAELMECQKTAPKKRGTSPVCLYCHRI
jgi:hypothetical protein